MLRIDYGRQVWDFAQPTPPGYLSFWGWDAKKGKPEMITVRNGAGITEESTTPLWLQPGDRYEPGGGELLEMQQAFLRRGVVMVRGITRDGIFVDLDIKFLEATVREIWS